MYNLKTDRTELRDLSRDFPEKRKELIAIYEKWAGDNNILPWKTRG